MIGFAETLQKAVDEKTMIADVRIQHVRSSKFKMFERYDASARLDAQGQGGNA